MSDAEDHGAEGEAYNALFAKRAKRAGIRVITDATTAAGPPRSAATAPSSSLPRRTATAPAAALYSRFVAATTTCPLCGGRRKGSRVNDPAETDSASQQQPPPTSLSSSEVGVPSTAGSHAGGSEDEVAAVKWCTCDQGAEKARRPPLAVPCAADTRQEGMRRRQQMGQEARRLYQEVISLPSHPAPARSRGPKQRKQPARGSVVVVEDNGDQENDLVVVSDSRTAKQRERRRQQRQRRKEQHNKAKQGEASAGKREPQRATPLPPETVSQRAFTHAQNNELQPLRQLADEQRHTFDPNAVDRYGWSLLQVAASAGGMAVVRWLLSLEEPLVNTRHTDMRGRTAAALAELSGHDRIAAAIEEAAATARIRMKRWGSQRGQERREQRQGAEQREGQAEKRERREQAQGTTMRRKEGDEEEKEKEEEEEEEEKEEETEEWFCIECGELQRKPRAEHNASVLHQFSCQHPIETRPFLLTAANKGYRLMKSIGWDERSGLGPSGTGKKQPVKTVLKRNRRGLGAADRAAAAREKREWAQAQVRARPSVPLIDDNHGQASSDGVELGEALFTTSRVHGIGAAAARRGPAHAHHHKSYFDRPESAGASTQRPALTSAAAVERRSGARVTHFAPGDVGAVAAARRRARGGKQTRAESKREREQQRQEQADRARQFMRMFAD